MLSKLSQMFKSNKETEEQIYLRENKIIFDAELGAIIDGKVVNELAERLEYFSNRKLQNFNDLRKLFEITPQINEKIDLEIATGRYVVRLDNTQENLLELKQVIHTLNQYFVKFLRNK